MAIAPLAIAGMAMMAAGTGLNYMQKKKAESRAKSVLKDSEKRVDQNSAMARLALNNSQERTTRPQQEADAAANTAERQGVYDAATADAADVALQPQADAPQVVKSESARQLGDQLGKARELMASRAKLGGWTDTLFDNSIALNRNSQDIGMYSNFSLGDAAAAQKDAAATAAKKGFPIGDILMGAGSLMSMGSGMAGMAAAPAAGAAGGAGAVLPLTGTVYSAATAPAVNPGWWSQAANWATTPIRW